jgi:glycosyltransferase involved in cell wall biosynthesis
LGAAHRAYADRALGDLRATDPTGHVVRYDGTIDRQQKKKFLTELDLLCVPSPYQEPKGLYVLEALAAGIPVVAPDHGAFPELQADTGGLELFRAGDVEDLTDVLGKLLADANRRRALGEQGRAAVIERRGARHAAEAVMAVYRELIEAH